MDRTFSWYFKRFRWKVVVGVLLVLASVLLYFAQIWIFRRTEDTFFYFLQDMAFVPIQVLLVTIILNEILSRREKESMKNKLNMVIGSFFSEMGMDLLKAMSGYDLNRESFWAVMRDNLDFSDKNLSLVRGCLKSHDYRIESTGQNLTDLKNFLVVRRDCVMRLLENPNLLEHETFTDLLWAVSHLTEELAYRPDPDRIRPPDRRHIETDIRRAYILLTTEWLNYVRHLRDNYPFIFSLVVRINPFNPEASPEVK
jgi:hypothetical protein